MKNKNKTLLNSYYINPISETRIKEEREIKELAQDLTTDKWVGEPGADPRGSDSQVCTLMSSLWFMFYHRNCCDVMQARAVHSLTKCMD